jgi:hypothetical protein
MVAATKLGVGRSPLAMGLLVDRTWPLRAVAQLLRWKVISPRGDSNIVTGVPGINADLGQGSGSGPGTGANVA